MSKILTLPDYVLKFIQEYRELELGESKVQCPYFINTKKRKDLRALVGKGTPEEILMEARIWEKLKGLNFSKMKPLEIKEFLISKGIGIDCSGFAIHVLNVWFHAETKKTIWSKMKFAPGNGIFRNLKLRIRPVENMGANTITGELNSDPIQISEVKPGDVIRSKWKKIGTHHIHLISKVEYDESGAPILIEYTHATPYYGEESGVKTGQIRILDVNKPLYDQEWSEKDNHGVNFSYEGFLTQVEDNGLRRLRVMKSLVNSIQ